MKFEQRLEGGINLKALRVGVWFWAERMVLRAEALGVMHAWVLRASKEVGSRGEVEMRLERWRPFRPPERLCFSLG